VSKKPWEFEQPLCAEIGVELFYSEDRDDVRPKTKILGDYNAARQVCGSCIHVADCAEWGIQHEVHGVWGGLSPQNREAIRKQRRITVNTVIFTI
jgi:hypothetical protein